MSSGGRIGQTETSFQWVFVLIGGVALLALLLGFASSCADRGQEEFRTIGVRGAVSIVSSAAWSGDSVRNTTLPDAIITCRAGALAFETEGEPQYLDRSPVFLPPTVGGRARIVTRAIALSPGTPAEFPVGGVAYTLDARTAYLIIQDRAGKSAALAEDLPIDPSIVSVPIDDTARADTLARWVPGSPRTVVIAIVGSDVDLARIDASGISDTIEVRAVALQPQARYGGMATLYRRDASNGMLVATGTLPYAHERLGLGMIISADRDVARCATDAFADRARVIVRIAQERASSLSDDTSDIVCGATLLDAANLLGTIDAKPGSGQFLGALFGGEEELFRLQSTLLSRPGTCPGVS